PNGAGKTTTIRMLYGMSPPTGGSLSVLGLDVRKDIRDIKRR
ncbi:MAG TPA: ABC transporter, partial [Actinobacteria bacterium]|nr:ABC transporter [Actinomycetota bacterium]